MGNKYFIICGNLSSTMYKMAYKIPFVNGIKILNTNKMRMNKIGCKIINLLLDKDGKGYNFNLC